MRVTLVLAAGLLPVALAAQPAGFVTTNHVSGLNVPTSIAFAPNGRLYVAEKGGTIKVFNGGTLVKTFATIPCSSNSERGVLGLAFDPNFTTNRFLYVYYTTTGSNPKNRVSRLTELNDEAVPGSEQVIVDGIASDAGNHNAGCIRFGMDGKLYIATGDGGSTPANSQNLANLAGKILRVNPDGSVPVDNPFFGQAGRRQEIFLYGLRNPFRFSMRPGTNTLYVADVGQNTWEEVNVGLPGGNYGWPTHEGTTTASGFVNPIHQYNHNSGGASITGGCFVGNKWPVEYQNRYLFGDFVLDAIRWLEVNASNTVVSNGEFMVLDAPVDFALGPDGALYIVSLSGVVKRIAYRPVPISITGPNVYGGQSGSGLVTLDAPAPAAGLQVNLTSSNSSVLAVPPTATLGPGATSVSFAYSTIGVATTQSSVVSASCNGVSKSRTIYVLPPRISTFVIDPVAVVGGSSTSATITLLGKAPVGGTTISLDSGAVGVAQVQSSLTIPEGQSSGSFPITTSSVSADTNVSIAATLGSQYVPRTLAVVVQLHRIASLTMTPNPVTSGSGTTGRVAITRPAPAGGLALQLTDNASIVTTPPTVTIPAGATVTTFPITTTAVNSQFTVNVQAKVGVSVRNSELVVLPCPIQSLAAFPATLPGGHAAHGQVVLREAAPQGGATVQLTDSSAWAFLPASVQVPAGTTSALFPINTVPVTQNVIVTMTASYLGATRSSTFTITNVAAVDSVLLAPGTFVGGTNSSGSVRLTKKAPPGGLTVSLSVTIAAASVPSTIRVGSGAEEQSFGITSIPVTTTTIGSVVATANGISRSATITLLP